MKKTIIMQALFAIMVLNISCGGKELSEYEYTKTAYRRLCSEQVSILLPNSCEGIYDRLVITRSDDLLFNSDRGEAHLGSEKVLSFYHENGKISHLYVYSPVLKTRSGLNCNSTAEEIFEHGGQAHVSILEEYTIKCDGVFFYGCKFNERGDMKKRRNYYNKDGDQEPYTADDYILSSRATSIMIDARSR